LLFRSLATAHKGLVTAGGRICKRICNCGKKRKKMDKICTFNFFSLSLPPEQVNFIKKERENLHLIIYMDCTRREL